MPEPELRRLSSHRRRFIVGTTVFWHASLALRPFAPGHRVRQILVRTATVGSDLLLARSPGKQADSTYPLRLALGVVWAWALSVDPPVGHDTARAVYSASATGLAAETGFEGALGADDTGWGPVLSRGAAAVVLPAIAASIARRRPRELGQTGWGVSALVAGAVFGAYVARLDRRQGEEFVREVEPRLRLEREITSLMVRTKASVAHDFKKTLLSIGLFGSPTSWAAGTSHAGRPAEAAGNVSGGHPLYLPARELGLWVDPPAAARVWVTDDQVRALRAFVERVDRSSHSEEPDPVLSVVLARSSSVDVVYRGEGVRLSIDAPRARWTVYPLPVMAAIAAFWKGLEVVQERPPGRRTPLMVGTVALDVAAAVWLSLRPSPASPRTMLAFSMASGAVFDLARTWGRTDRPMAEVKAQGTNGLMGAVVVLSVCWSEIGALRRPGAALLAVLWCLTDVPWSAGPGVALQGVLWLAQMFAASFDASDGWRREAEDRNRSREADVEATLNAIGQEEAEAELEHLRNLLSVARSELAVVGPTMASELVQLVERDCDDLDAWLSAPERATWLSAY